MHNIIYNPNARGGKNQGILKKIENAFKKHGIEYSLYPSHFMGEIKRIVKRLTSADNDDSIVAIGGDGTVSEVLNGYVDFERHPLGIVPAGTGNDFASSIGLDTAEKSIEKLVRNEWKYTDYIQLEGGVRTMNVCGMGLDVEVLKRYQMPGGTKGKIRYFKCLLSTLLHFEPTQVSFTVDGVKHTHNAFVVAACNGTRFGGGLKICPHSVCDDGLIDLVVVDYVGGMKIIPLLLAFLQGKLATKPQTHCFKVSDIEISMTPPSLLNVDGELLDIPLKASCVSKQLRIYR